MKHMMIAAVCCSLFMTGLGQSTNLPIKTLNSHDATKPLVFFATGDGGWTSFSTGFMEALNKAGYPVVALNSKDYFWKKKTPAQTAADVSSVLRTWLNSWKRDSVVLIGYSFGADITPFVQNRLPEDLAARTKRIVLMIPYRSTDFEVHLTEMLGIGSKDTYSVPDEVNKIANKPILFVMGTEKSQFPLSSLHIHQYKSLTIAGGHHFDDNASVVAQSVLGFVQ